MLDPQRFMSVARELLERAPAAEEHVRTAYGRAYYAAFLVAREKLHEAFPPPDSVRLEHSDVIESLSRSHHPKLRSLGQDLWDLKDKRTRADYDLDANRVQLDVTPGECARTIAAAAQWIQRFAGFTPGSLRAQVYRVGYMQRSNR